MLGIVTFYLFCLCEVVKREPALQDRWLHLGLTLPTLQGSVLTGSWKLTSHERFYCFLNLVLGGIGLSHSAHKRTFDQMPGSSAVWGKSVHLTSSTAAHAMVLGLETRQLASPASLSRLSSVFQIDIQQGVLTGSRCQVFLFPHISESLKSKYTRGQVNSIQAKPFEGTLAWSRSPSKPPSLSKQW